MFFFKRSQYNVKRTVCKVRTNGKGIPHAVLLIPRGISLPWDGAKLLCRPHRRPLPRPRAAGGEAARRRPRRPGRPGQEEAPRRRRRRLTPARPLGWTPTLPCPTATVDDVPNPRLSLCQPTRPKARSRRPAMGPGTEDTGVYVGVLLCNLYL